MQDCANDIFFVVSRSSWPHAVFAVSLNVGSYWDFSLVSEISEVASQPNSKVNSQIFICQPQAKKVYHVAPSILNVLLHTNLSGKVQNFDLKYNFRPHA
jgi:uncharacterized pyridoxamine 5'-phosphate oxidase family protein